MAYFSTLMGQLLQLISKLEHTARLVLAARLHRPLPPLPAAEVEKLLRLGGGSIKRGVNFGDC